MASESALEEGSDEYRRDADENLGSDEVRTAHEGLPSNVSQINIKIASDSTTPGDVPGICMVPSGFILVTDWRNYKVKVLNSEFEVVDSLTMTNKPYAFSVLQNTGHIALTMRDCRELAILKIDASGHVSLVRKLPVPVKARGICSVKAPYGNCDTLFMNSGGDYNYNEGDGTVSLFTYGGLDKNALFPLQTFKPNVRGQKLFPRNIVTNKAGDKIFVSDANQGVVVFDADGKMIDVLTDPKLQQARGLCIDKNDNIYVAGMKSANVVVFGANGKFLREVMNQSHGLKRPISLFYDDTNSRLFVGSTSNSPVCVMRF